LRERNDEGCSRDSLQGDYAADRPNEKAPV
jgi:hypothetical protein